MTSALSPQVSVHLQVRSNDLGQFSFPLQRLQAVLDQQDVAIVEGTGEGAESFVYELNSVLDDIAQDHDGDL